MQYEVKALREREGVVAFALDAPDETEAIRLAKAQGYTVLAVKEKGDWWARLPRREVKFPLGLFSQELLALLDAGLNLVEALETLVEKEDRPENKRVLWRVIGHLYEGQPLSFALQQFPAQFPALYVATVRASERTGDLSRALSRYVGYQEQMDVIRRKVRSASLYPSLLLIVSGLVVLFLMGYVVPKFSRIYEDMGSNLPFLSELLLRWGKLLQTHGAAALFGFVFICVAVGYGLTRAEFKAWVVRRLWQIPAIGYRMKIYQLARFYRTLGMLLDGGIPIVTALRMSSDLLQSSLRNQLREAAESVREGQSLSHSMQAHSLTTPVALRLLSVGERTGEMGAMMDRIAAFYDEDMARWVDWFTKLFEPLLMAFIGIVIGGIVVLMYFPIFELAGSLQ
jgi:general secretion pathway protein F